MQALPRLRPGGFAYPARPPNEKAAFRVAPEHGPEHKQLGCFKNTSNAVRTISGALSQAVSRLQEERAQTQ